MQPRTMTKKEQTRYRQWRKHLLPKSRHHNRLGSVHPSLHRTRGTHEALEEVGALQVAVVVHKHVHQQLPALARARQAAQRHAALRRVRRRCPARWPAPSRCMQHTAGIQPNHYDEACTSPGAAGPSWAAHSSLYRCTLQLCLGSCLTSQTPPRLTELSGPQGQQAELSGRRRQV